MSTLFFPPVHGFHFSNNDIAWSVGPFSGKHLCGGMAYAALDYYYNQMGIPPDKAAPAEGTPLHSYIYGRQTTAHVNTFDRFSGSWIFGGTGDPQAEWDKLSAYMQGNTPIPICLAGAFCGHHLVAVGLSGTEPPSITAYDPNVPDRTATIYETADGQLLNSPSGTRWNAFFVDDRYSIVTPAVLSGQSNWRWCRKCQGMFFGGDATQGVCPSGGTHDSSGSGDYVLPLGSGSGEPNWRWCWKCQGLYYAGDPSSAGLCPDGGIHNGSRSGNYALARDSGIGQGNWRRCYMCEGLFFAGAGSLGVCPGNSSGHDGSRSANYCLPGQ